MTEKDLRESCAAVLGEEIFDALESARTGLPQILKLAALKAFEEDWDSDSFIARDLRKALKMLGKGYFTFEEEPKK
ncbi:MAG: hypothetical protein V3S55_07695 [Nitrospiraceae bacterium]